MSTFHDKMLDEQAETGIPTCKIKKGGGVIPLYIDGRPLFRDVPMQTSDNVRSHLCLGNTQTTVHQAEARRRFEDVIDLPPWSHANSG